MADFDDGKDAEALRTIGEVSDALGIKPHVLRYWEQQFVMLTPLKRSGGRRYYRPGDIAMVEAINQLVNEEGYTLKGAATVLKDADRRVGKPDRRKRDRRHLEDEEGGSAFGFSKRSPEEALALSEAIPKLKSIRARLADILDD